MIQRLWIEQPQSLAGWKCGNSLPYILVLLFAVRYLMVCKAERNSGDVNLIRIGAYTNIQEGTVITESFDPLNDDHDGSTIVGHYVTISIENSRCKFL